MTSVWEKSSLPLINDNIHLWQYQMICFRKIGANHKYELGDWVS